MTNTYYRGAKTPEVSQLQKKLIELGYNLPRFGADGELGGETVTALEHWGLDMKVENVVDGISDEEIPRACADFLSWYDDMRGRTPRGPRHIVITGDLANAKGVRSWKTVDSIVLHQTACVLSIDRWKIVPIHFGVPRSSGYLGRFFQLHPLLTYLYHANRLNAPSVGIEIEGNFPGVDSDRGTWWPGGGGPHKVEPAQIEAARALIAWTVAEANAGGGAIKKILAHRQASHDRRGDPGDVIWKEVGLWAMHEFNLSDGGENFTSGEGYRLPDVWTGTNRGIAY